MSASPELPGPSSSRHETALGRVTAALSGSLLGSALAGLVSGALRFSTDRVGASLREGALFVFLSVPAFALIAPGALLAGPRRRSSVRAVVHERATELAAIAGVGAPSLVLWVGVASRVAQRFMTAFHHVGLAALALTVTLGVGTVLFVAAAALVARGVVRRIERSGRRRDGLRIAVIVGGCSLAAALVTLGVRSGDTNGRGGWLGALGVLKRPELDLSPVWGLVGAFGLAGLLAVLTARAPRVALAGLVVALAVDGALVRFAALRFADAPSAAAIEARPGLSRALLRAVRARLDRDHDGASAFFGGGDCDDRDARRSPDAIDRPANGIDEDCSGSDAPALAPRVIEAPPPGLAERIERALPRDANLLLITVDTLRWDLHYAGNPRELSPNLDRLASRSIVFDRAYALSSYTGRAVGPLLAGRYPTECARDSEHFTRYPPANVLLGERLHDAGFRTLGAASHFYFERRFGLAQGFDVWDLSALPGGDEQESTSNDARVADRAIALLNAPESRGRRLFLWAHFFDPHKQYVPHPELGVSFGSGERARYDAEVAWTDRQIGRVLDALDASPFARNTIVVLTADHGEAFGEHGMSWHGVELWEELVRVPLLLSVPGFAPRHVAARRSQIDLVPTLLALLRLPTPAPDAPDALSGVSLVPELLGEPAAARPIYIELPEGPFNSLRRALIVNDLKLLERGARRFYLYDLATDPGERVDISTAERERQLTMRAEFERLRAGLRVVAPLP